MSLTLIVILLFAAIIIGMVLSVTFFGTGGKRAHVFQDIYFSIEDVDGMGVYYTKRGDIAVTLRMQNPVLKYSADTENYYGFLNIMNTLVTILGEGYAIHKQDVFSRNLFTAPDMEGEKSDNFLSNAYFRLFEDRPYTLSMTYLTITQENAKGGVFTFNEKQWKAYLSKINKVISSLDDAGINCSVLTVAEARAFADRFFCQNFKDSVYSMTNLKVDSEGIMMGRRNCKVFSIVDVEDPGVPNTVKPFLNKKINNSNFPIDFMCDLDNVPDVDTLVYNQVVFIPNQKKEQHNIELKKNRRISMSSKKPGEKDFFVDEIASVQEAIDRDNQQLVYSHFNLIVTIAADKSMDKVTNQLENIFNRKNILLSRRAYNQQELFVNSFPGNCYAMNKDYDRFLTIADAAFCMMYKERQTTGDNSSLKLYYTDRQGVPMAIDITGMECTPKLCDNMNFFTLGPSGSGKSFFMNTVCRQLYEQNTDLVIVDTGDSYEGLCEYFHGTYISYSKEKPISMNPFNITEIEYTKNFSEKKSFLSSLIFLIFKGSAGPNKIEETIINQTIVEYYQEYFHPFEGFNDKEREQLHETLLLEAQSNGSYADFEKKEQSKAIDKEVDNIELSAEEREKLERRMEKLDNMAERGGSEGEREISRRLGENVRNQLMKVNTLVSVKFDHMIELEIDKIEQQRRKLRVTELSFNSYYEFAMQRIPQIMSRTKVDFEINEFRTILSTFYRGGELEYTLNNDMGQSLFDERFIVFEIDKIKDDPVLFPIVVLIIMDVFTQKMRIKDDCRKCLVIEEAWKAIATPIMATYIQYLYKTARKHKAMVGVVTQELQDVISSPIVKEAIINNSDVFMLLDQAKFKDKFADIQTTLALSDNDCAKIFTINRLDNKDGRSPFKEVFIKRGQVGDVFGVEEPLECYMSYTTNKDEKVALKLYKRELGCDHQQAIVAFVRDFRRSGIKSTLAFSLHVTKVGHVLNLPPKKRRVPA